MDIKVLKLISGEELIGEITKAEDEVLYIKHPLGLAVNPEEGRLVFVPYMPYTSAPEEIIVPYTSLLIEPLAPVESIAHDYQTTIQKIFNKVYVPPERSIIRPVS